MHYFFATLKVVKQTDVAEYCNVSPAAVSKILRHPSHPEFPEATRKRILAAARELNYVPNQLAAGLRRGRSSSISLLSFCNVTELQDHVTIAAKKADYGVELELSQGPGWASLPRVVRSVLSRKPAGVIWLPGWGDMLELKQAESAELLRMVRHMGRPVVWLEDTPPPDNSDADFVWCDDEGGIEQAVEHLHEQGYEHFVFLMPRGLPRELRGPIFAQAVARRGFPARLVEESVPETRATDPAVHQLVADCPPNTAILCEGDWPAVPVLHAARRFGRAIPDELGLMLYGDQHLGGGFSVGELTHPMLSAIRRPLDQIGRRAVQHLLERIDGAYTGPLRRDVLPTELIVRESTRRKAP